MYAIEQVSGAVDDFLSKVWTLVDGSKDCGSLFSMLVLKLLMLPALN
jgi:hypothetical protein